MKRSIVHLTVNGDSYSVAVDASTTLVELLRDRLHLTGTKLGCGTGDCGSCTVSMNGRTINSCLTLAMEADGAEITTIEGIAPSGRELHAVQAAFVRHGAIQCGFCTPGMVVSSVELLRENPRPSDDQIRHAIGGNLCRCTGYAKIVAAISALAAGEAARDVEKPGMRLPDFEFHSPRELPEVFELLRAHGRAARLMSGGTDLLPAMRSGKLSCEHVIGLKRVEKLDGLSFDEARGLTIGANALLADVADHPVTRERYPALATAIDGLATVQVRHKGTVAGNLCHASPCADTATPLMALGARILLTGPDGSREMSVEDFFVGPGTTALSDIELVESIRLPTPADGLRAVFTKYSPRSSVDIAAVSSTLALTMAQDSIEEVALFLGTVAPTPLRAVAAEAVLRGARPTPERIDEAARAARGECRPISDHRASAEYKARMVYVLTRRALEALTVAP